MASQHDLAPKTTKEIDITDVGSDFSVQEDEVARQDNELSDEVLLDKSNADWQLGKSLGESLLYLYENKLWTDVSFRCKDHEVDDKDDRIRAHRAILAARSPFFHKMLFVYDKISGDKEDQELPTVEAQIFHLIVKYMYSDMTDLTEDVAARVMEIADMYQIQGLVQYCANYLKTILRSDNACEILDLALFYRTHELRDAACDFIDDNAASVMESKKFMDISKSCLTYILKGDTFYTDEAEIVEAADSWAFQRLNEQSKGNSGLEKRKLLGEGFFYLRIPSMKMEEFLDCTQYKEFYSTEEVYEIMDLIVHKRFNGYRFSCHSLVKRVPRQETLNMEPIKPVSKEKCSEIKCDMLLTVFRDCEIKCLRLNDSCDFLFNNHKLLQEKACFVFRGKLTIDDIYEIEFDWIPLKTDEISLKCPITLPKKSIFHGYRMRLNLCLANDPKITVEVDKYQCTSRSRLPALGLRAYEGENKIMTLTYSKKSTHVNIIKSIDIRTFSNRNSEELPKVTISARLQSSLSPPFPRTPFPLATLSVRSPDPPRLPSPQSPIYNALSP